MNAKEFVRDNFDYLNKLIELSVKLTCNRYLLEYVANGFATYGSTVDDFVNNVDKWLRSLAKVYREIGFDHKTKQIKATIDLTDQLILIDDNLINDLEYIIETQKKYGLLINFHSDKRQLNNTTTLAVFFEYIQDRYPKINDRFKGLGSSSASVSKTVIMNPKTRRLIRVTMEDADMMRRMASMLVGDGKENINARKEMLLNFKFDKEDIDN